MQYREEFTSEVERKLQDECIASQLLVDYDTMFTECKRILDKVGTYESDKEYREAHQRLMHAIDGVPGNLSLFDFGRLMAFDAIRHAVENGMRRAQASIDAEYGIRE